MKIGIRQRLLLFSLIMLVGNGLIGYVVYRSNQKILESEQWVQHTENILYRSATILSLGKDIETASRGFVITNDSAFLESLFDAEKKIFSYIVQLRQLTQGNPRQQQRVDSLNFYVHKRLEFSLQTIKIRSEDGLASAIAYISTKLGKHYSDRMRQLTDAIQQEANALLKQRKQTNEHSVSSFNRFLAAILALVAVFTILLLVAIGKYLLLTKQKEKRAEELIIANKELAFQSKEKEKRAGELIIANKELAFQNEEKEKRAEELNLANKELESFSYSVSHDLRAPLRAVHGYARMLKEDYGTTLDHEGNRVMNCIMNNATKMGTLLDDLLTFSRLGRKQLLKINIPMNQMVTNLCSEQKNEHGNRAIQFNINNLHPAQGDSAAIKQVWVNLISNAVKYYRLNEKTFIEIGSEIKEDEIIYFIKDNGVGFDMRYANKLFGVFQRLHSEEEFEGNGVGLAIVQRIIAKHGGRVWAEGKVNEGAIFYFSLPINASV